MSNHPEILIAGAGFGGIAMGVALKKAGIENFTIHEKSSEVGGVWHDNIYPGSACDVPSLLYAYSFEPDFGWSTHYALHDEILAYMKHCAEKYGLMSHIRLSSEITAARFDPDEAWRIETAAGEEIRADIFISAVGIFDRPALPQIPGLKDFAGPQFHSARWDYSQPLEGKRVGVIGTGASTIQFVPAIAPRVKQLLVFQRSPQYVLSKHDPGRAPRGSLAWRRWQRLAIFWKFGRGTRRGKPVQGFSGKQNHKSGFARQTDARLSPGRQAGLAIQ